MKCSFVYAKLDIMTRQAMKFYPDFEGLIFVFSGMK
jgi:hypothetical protein